MTESEKKSERKVPPGPDDFLSCGVIVVVVVVVRRIVGSSLSSSIIDSLSVARDRIVPICLSYSSHGLRVSCIASREAEAPSHC